MQREAWGKITQSTMANCYRRASFVKPTEEADNPEDETQEVLVPLGMEKEEFDRYVAVDEGLPTDEGRSDAEICAGIMQSQQSEATDDTDLSSDEEDEMEPIITFASATQSLDVLRRFMEKKGCASFDSFYSLQNEIHQAKVPNFCADINRKLFSFTSCSTDQ